MKMTYIENNDIAENNVPKKRENDNVTWLMLAKMTSA